MSSLDEPEVARAIFREVHDGVLLVDPTDLSILDANPAILRFSGFRRKELLTRKLTEVIEAEVEDDFLEFVRGVQSTSCSAISERFLLRCANGSARPMQWTSSRIHVEPQPLGLIVGRDVSAIRRLEEERRKVLEQMWHAQKLESLGVMAGGIAHDFNNLLTTVIGFAELALRQMPAESSEAKFIREAQKSASKAADLSRMMLAYSGHAKLQLERISLTQIVREVAASLESVGESKARWQFDLSGYLPPIEGDVVQLRQVLFGILANALEAIVHPPSVVGVRTFERIVDDPAALSTCVPTDVQAGTFAVVEISDDGCGIEEVALKRIFDPFYSTKFVGRGLGLAAALGIVRAHRGFIEVRSQIGKGSVFAIHLPFSRSKPEHVELKLPRSAALSEILVVEDDSALCEYIARVLPEIGCRAVVAGDGLAGKQAFENNPQGFVCILLDMTLPRMPGTEVLAAIRAISPKVPIIAMSGYTETSLAELPESCRPTAFLAKPFLPDQLLTMLRLLIRPA